MKLKSMIPAILAVTAVSVWAGGDKVKSFSEADMDRDGRLSAKEAQMSLPGVKIKDENGDGMLSQAEVENSLPAVSFEGEDATKDNLAIGEEQYQKIVKAIEKDHEKGTSYKKS